MGERECTVASVPAREYVFVLTDSNTRAGKGGEGGGEADNKVLGAYDRDVLINENGKLLLGFAEDNKLALLNNFFVSPKVACPTRSKALTAARDKHIWTEQEDHGLIRYVNVRRLPLEAPELDNNLVYTKIRIPRRSALNGRKADSTKETPKTADLRRLMADPNL